jgi:hypothetical protein
MKKRWGNSWRLNWEGQELLCRGEKERKDPAGWCAGWIERGRLCFTRSVPPVVGDIAETEHWLFLSF